MAVVSLLALEILLSKLAKFETTFSFSSFFLHTLLNQLFDLWLILELAFIVGQSEIRVPILIRVSRIKVDGGRHVNHDHSSSKNIDQIGVLSIRGIS